MNKNKNLKYKYYFYIIRHQPYTNSIYCVYEVKYADKG